MADNDAGNIRQEGQSGALWMLRRAELDWLGLVQKTMSDHQERSATARAEYHRAVGQIVEEVANDEKAALESAAEYQKPDITPERRVAILREWDERVAEIRRTAFTRIAEAGAKLADAQQQSWLDAARKQNEAYTAYVSATADPNPAGSPFPLGDEGRGVPPFSWNWMDPYMGPGYTGYRGGRW
jgi:hypothetical protein